MTAQHGFIGSQQMRHNNCEDWRCGVQDSRLSGRNMPLTPHNKAKRNHIVQKTHDEEGPPDRQTPWKRAAHHTQHQKQD